MSAQNLSTAIICRSPTVRSISLLWLQLAWTRPQDVKADGFSCAYLYQPNYPLIRHWMVISAFQSARKGYKVSLLQFESHLLVSYLAMIHTGSNGIWYHIIFNIIFLSLYTQHKPMGHSRHLTSASKLQAICVKNVAITDTCETGPCHICERLRFS